METPAHLSDPADPATPANPVSPAEEHASAKQPGKWALVRSLNQALKTYAVMPVRRGPGRGGRALGTAPRPQFFRKGLYSGAFLGTWAPLGAGA